MRKILLIALMILMPAFVFSQDSKPTDRHVFTKVYDVKATSVKNQGGTGTCWDFATSSFLESELLRMGKGEYNLSEMFVARNAYISKTEQLIRLGGKNNFGQGGQAHDVIDVLRTKGLMPEEAYSGLINGEKMHNHSEMESILSMLATNFAVPKAGGGQQMGARKPSTHWQDVMNAVMDAFIGKVPENFTYNGKEYTPITFAKELGLNPDDYIEITSFSLFPFYTQGHIPVQDNWSHGHYYNLPLDEIGKVMEYALKNGYTVDWDGDVSEKGFMSGAGYAIVPEGKDEDSTKPEKEKVITDDLHLASFNDFSTTDDHLMHITGMAKDQAGTTFWLTKNSWGPGGKFGGYLYMSDAYTKYKLIAIMVHKNAIPKDIKAKLGIN